MTEPTLAQAPKFKTACGGILKDPTNYSSALYRGERVYFCNRACLSVFEQDPDAFISGDVEHPIEGE